MRFRKQSGILSPHRPMKAVWHFISTHTYVAVNHSCRIKSTFAAVSVQHRHTQKTKCCGTVSVVCSVKCDGLPGLLILTARQFWYCCLKSVVRDFKLSSRVFSLSASFSSFSGPSLLTDGDGNLRKEEGITVLPWIKKLVARR